MKNKVTGLLSKGIYLFSPGILKTLMCKNSRGTKISSHHYVGVNQCHSIIIKWIAWPDIDIVVGKCKNKLIFFFYSGFTTLLNFFLVAVSEAVGICSY